MKKNADLTMKFTRILSEELGYSNSRTISLTQKHIRGRLAESLIVLRDTYGFDEDGKTLNVSLSREDIAGLSNMTTSNAIRTLSGLSSDGIIGVKGRRITIIDTTTLEHICNLG
jgi:CRP-like cAMP-binding protein